MLYKSQTILYYNLSAYYIIKKEIFCNKMNQNLMKISS